MFHLGAIRRLNELGALSRLTAITSVSGGSILNGALASRWGQLRLAPSGAYENLTSEILQPVREFCAEDLRTPLLLGARLNPIRWPELARSGGAVSGNALARGYSNLFSGARLDALPAAKPGSTPRFIFCATNARTGACWHFHGGPDGRMGDFYTGYTSTAGVTVADAVAASSAFPPGFSALRLALTESRLTRVDPWGNDRPLSRKRKSLAPGDRPALLCDGGVYDNLGVEPVFERSRCLVVSDAGRPFASRARCRQWIVPRLKRASQISMDQVGAVRKRWLFEGYRRGTRSGVIWTISTPFEEFTVPGVVGYGSECRELFSVIRTDLNSFSHGEISCLENHGYAMADGAMRSHALELCAVPDAPIAWPDSELAADTSARHALARSGRRRVIFDCLRWGMPRRLRRRRK